MKLLNWYIEQGSNINEVDSDGLSVLIYAIKQNNEKQVEFLVDKEDLNVDYLDQ